MSERGPNHLLGVMARNTPSTVGLESGQKAGLEANCCRRESTPVISLDFADAMCDAVEVYEDGSRESGDWGPGSAILPMSAILGVFELCHPHKDDCAIDGTNLQKVLARQFHNDDAVHTIFEIIDELCPHIPHGHGSIDFFSYWLCMEVFLQDRGAFSQALCHAQHDDELDVVQGARKLRDHVLNTFETEVSLRSPTPELLQVVLQACVDDEKHRVDLMFSFLQERKTLAQFGGIIYACLKKHLEANQIGDSTLWELQDPGAQIPAMSPMEGSRSLSFASSRSPDHRRASSASDVGELCQMHELVEIVERSLNRGDGQAHSAMRQIMRRHEGLSLKLKQWENQVSSLESDLSALGEERNGLREELLQAREFCEDMEELKRECEKHKRRASALEQQLSELEVNYRSESQKLSKLQVDHADVSREHADCQRRLTRLHEHCENLESKANISEERVQELEAVSSNAKRQSEQLSSELERLQFSSNLANVLQRRSVCSRLARVDENMSVSKSPQDEQKNLSTELAASQLLQDEEKSASSSSSQADSDVLSPLPGSKSEPSNQVLIQLRQQITQLQQHVSMQQTQLQSLRDVRDELFAANGKLSSQPNSASLRAMLQHTKQLEQLLDQQNQLGGEIVSATPARENLNDVAQSTTQTIKETLLESLSTSPDRKSFASSCGKSCARTSAISTSAGRTSVTSGVFELPDCASISVASSTPGMQVEEPDHADDFMLGRSGLDIEPSPKKTIKDTARVVARVQRVVASLQVPQQERHDRRPSGESSGVSSSRSRGSTTRADKAEGSSRAKEEHDDSSWMPSLSGWYTALSGADAEEDSSTDEEEHKRHRRSHGKHDTTHHSHHRSSHDTSHHSHRRSNDTSHHSHHRGPGDASPHRSHHHSSHRNRRSERSSRH